MKVEKKKYERQPEREKKKTEKKSVIERFNDFKGIPNHQRLCYA